MKLSNIHKNGGKTKISRDAKSTAEFGKKHCQLKTTCGNNLKFTQKMQIVEKFFCMKKYREPAF